MRKLPDEHIARKLIETNRASSAKHRATTKAKSVAIRVGCGDDGAVITSVLRVYHAASKDKLIADTGDKTTVLIGATAMMYKKNLISVTTKPAKIAQYNYASAAKMVDDHRKYQQRYQWVMRHTAQVDDGVI